ncbi:tetratricopeptide repeat protein [Actinomadura rupiterrae]|uniref:tetratricopeptide repeat protein n=1 Tax=Actinomadura rupiterrae TaxID=559627 RepID=UPI0020A418C6|nr:tetratricopeptide repeat protein [Actinomadura rupiterrae]MCP2335934.1 tetratricopeptide (TPR) repeat protein [Actinomadura rupiterrae]
MSDVDEVRISADRRVGGPYTAGAALLDVLAREAVAERPELLAAYDIELRAVAPDLGDLVPARRVPLVDRVDRSERILVPAARRTLRIANGVAEFVRAWLEASGRPRTVVLDGYAEADPADAELVAVLRRRVDSALLNVQVEDAPSALPGDDLDPAGHAACADELEASGRIGPRLGLVLHHRDRAGDPARAAASYAYAVSWCLDHGCHDAAAELGRRGIEHAESAAKAGAGSRAPSGVWWELVHATAMALSALRREDEAEHLLHHARATTDSPVWHSTIAYSLGMLAVRHHDPGRRDLSAALAWTNTAIAICGLLPDPAERAIKLGFDLNGRALVESRLGRDGEALRLVQDAIDLADRDLPPGAQPVHRMVLLANRAMVLDRLGRTTEALADWTAVIDADPVHPDYYIDRGNLLLRLGRPDDAVADYETAMAAGPPFPEPYFNRSEIRFAEGDHEGALADLDHALDLDPAFAEARTNRAGLLTALGRHAEARTDCEAGLAHHPGDAHLLSVLGQIEAAEGRADRARAAFDQALAGDPTLAAAWAARGVLAYETGDPDMAVADLTQSLVLVEDPAVLFNRAVVLRTLNRIDEARTDLERAQALSPDDPDIEKALADLD